uniref:3-deoxy-manno-octulosonate cytidylyltransferase n=1 Tax=Candidatus Kentrum sp. LPFa TaxID=2126335 RepID=A0A450X506_9GAMM|nr:MAG: 3-deoxy-manno-octulosonate cytidylyltransferase (CMP-KDO synthetase) [Candidatus Kentron sp. LPFa]VFK35825.1 MAG: 3-deoxy-manno-octulosonate cytidylyltransferase (CMP-KDO synthetase) [Candidatus Kentron sp. LPFa]
MRFSVIIPARYASSRFPGKPLAEIAGKPMLQHVYALASASGATDVIIATDDERIRKAATDFGAKVCMTSENHASGTERIAEAIEKVGEPDHGIIINIQGDEPLLPPGLARQVAEDLSDHSDAQVATLCERITDTDTLFDPGVVKVVMGEGGYALYFSRLPIPYDRDHFENQANFLMPPETPYYRHIGIYAYRAAFLRDYAARPRSALEKAESLEQLRVLHHGEKIHVSEAKEAPGIGVDTPADLKRVQEILEGKNENHS